MIAGSEGNPATARLWLVGRDYGEVEERLGLPFQGPAGSLLNKALAQAGIRREDCFITNVVNKRPPKNVWELHAPGDVKEGLYNLEALLAKHKPKLVVALGNEALRAVLRDEALPGIQECRGYLWVGWWGGMHHVQGCRSQQGDHPCNCVGDYTESPLVIGIIHPAAALREWTPWRVLIDVDFKKAAAELATGCPPLPEREIRIVTDELEAALAVEGLLKAKRLAVDIETTRDNEVACCGFAPTPEVAWVFPARYLDAIKTVCESAVPKILQNGGFDRYVLAKAHGIHLRNHAFDVMLGWHVLMPELAGAAQGKKGSKRTEKSLRFLASIFTREPYWKDYSFATDEDRYKLNGKDCCVTLEIADKLEELLI